MENYPINLQIKDGVIRKIRPGVWYSEKITDYAIFENLGDFVSAIEAQKSNNIYSIDF